VPENLTEASHSREVLFKIGDRLADLLITDVLANKRYVDVYLAMNVNDQSVCVIKLLNREKLKTSKNYDEELADLEREYVMLKRVQHIPYISQAYGFNKDEDNTAYIRVEYIKGKSLSRFLKQEEHLNYHISLKLIKNMLCAFSLLHQSEIIHGDIHPSNILITENNDPRIIDLGLSVDTSTDGEEVMKIGGVNYYLPPERINISSLHKFTTEPDLYSDVYQLGLMMYFILYRKEPFSAFIWEDLSKKIKEDDIFFHAESFSGFKVSPEMIRIIKKCVSKDPSKRYKDAGSILEDVKLIAV
jgi:serine/threonine-protein kinase